MQGVLKDVPFDRSLGADSPQKGRRDGTIGIEDFELLSVLGRG